MIGYPHRLILDHHMRWLYLSFCLVSCIRETHTVRVDAKQINLRPFTCMPGYIQNDRTSPAGLARACASACNCPNRWLVTHSAQGKFGPRTSHPLCVHPPSLPSRCASAHSHIVPMQGLAGPTMTKVHNFIWTVPNFVLLTKICLLYFIFWIETHLNLNRNSFLGK